MSNLELKRKELELLKVETGRKELEFKIEEKLEEIGRLKSHIEIQKNREEELRNDLAVMKG